MQLLFMIIKRKRKI